MAFVSCSTPERGSTIKTFSRLTLRTVRQTKEQQVSVPVPSSAQPTPNSIHDSSQRGSHTAQSNPENASATKTAAATGNKPKLILVAHYRE